MRRALGALTTDCGAAAGVSYAKIGLAGCRRSRDWPARWRAAIARWPAACRPVAVVYADWQRADAPSPDEVLAEAIAIGCPALLVDTWDKSAGGLFDHWPPKEVAPFCRRVHERELASCWPVRCRRASLETAVRCRPNLIAVRGAVCDGGRNGADFCGSRTRGASVHMERAHRMQISDNDSCHSTAWRGCVATTLADGEFERERGIFLTTAAKSRYLEAPTFQGAIGGTRADSVRQFAGFSVRRQSCLQAIIGECIVTKSVLDAIREGNWNFEPENVDVQSFDATHAIPGTDEKLKVLAERVQAGLPLWHEKDRPDYEDPVD